NEAPVDLHLGRRNLLEIRERRVSLAEVVDREPDAELAHPLETGRGRGIAGHQALLRQLDDEADPRRLQIVVQLAEARKEVGMRQHLRRDVHGDGQRVVAPCPSRQTFAYALEYEPR